MQQKICPFVIGLSLALMSAMMAPAWAEKADRDKDLNANADNIQGNSDNQTYQLKGNVVLTKGTLILRADTADVRQDPQGFDYATATAAAGKQVYYKQKRDVPAGQPEEHIEATADKIEYDGKLDTVKLVGNAVLKRLRSGKPADESVGSSITINNLTGEFLLAGGALVTPENPKGRAQLILSPRNNSNAAAEPKPDPAKLKPSPSASGAPK